MKRVVIIGGGISGLAAAHRIRERSDSGSVHLTLLEAGPQVGGLVQTEERNGFLLEHGPDSFISEKPQALRLAKRLGLESHLIETNPDHRRSFIVRKGRLLPVPDGFQLMVPSRLWPFVTSNIFSWPGKVRMALDLVLPRSRHNGNARGETEDESLADFVRRRLGSEALERMAQPMIGGIYTADPEKLSLRATMPRFLEMEREHRSLIRALWKQGRNLRAKQTERRGNAPSGTSGARYSLFLSFDRGMQLLTDKLAERIARPEVTRQEQRAGADVGNRLQTGERADELVQLNTRVESLRLIRSEEGSRWQIKTNRAEEIAADAICLALPAHASAKLLGNIDNSLANELDGISYASSATLSLAYKRADIPHPLDGFGFVVPFLENRSLIACTFSSVKFAGRAPEGHVLLRAFIGGALQPEMLELDDDKLTARVCEDLRDLMGIQAAPLFSVLSRWEGSMPQYDVGHLDRIRRINQSAEKFSGLTLAGNAYGGPGLPDCIRSGEEAADRLIGHQ